MLVEFTLHHITFWESVWQFVWDHILGIVIGGSIVLMLITVFQEWDE